jgi:hypothetical protein
MNIVVRSQEHDEKPINFSQMHLDTKGGHVRMDMHIRTIRMADCGVRARGNMGSQKDANANVVKLLVTPIISQSWHYIYAYKQGT